jgi:eukaryotic-like serine/threonine-protein kinase
VSHCARCGLTQPSSELALCPRCLLSADELAPPEIPGLRFAQEIGRGGMGRVFRAEQLRLGRDVAVKLLPPQDEPALETQARFEREARALGRLQHPHIVSVYDFGLLPDNERYLVMEFVPGGTLRERIPLPPAEAVRVACELCQALAYAHEQGVVHRDIKPDNVLFDAEGRVKIADFGIARFVDNGAGDTLTRPQQVLGTPGFVAPEALAGAPPAPSMDIYALGVLLQVMLHGRLGSHPDAGVAPELAALVRRATALDPQERPASARAMRHELERLALAVAYAPGATAEVGELPPDEQSWLRATALTLSGATALSLYALLVSITPRAMERSDLTTFVVSGGQPLPDGRLFTRARFETLPTLAAAAAWAVAFFAYGLLRSHWRKEQLEVNLPEQPLAGTRALFKLALVLNAIFVLRLLLVRAGLVHAFAYVPVLAGVLELVMLYLFWSAVLGALRTRRSLRRESLLWAGLVLSLLPPCVSFAAILAGVPL